MIQPLARDSLGSKVRKTVTLVMADFDGSFLEEQLERMRRLNERLSQAHNRVVENSENFARDRDRLPWCAVPAPRVRARARVRE